MVSALGRCARALVVASLLFFPALILPDIAHARGHADVYVHGYVRKDGTYVQPHMRSAPDGNFLNNWSTKGNVNPYTGVPGTRTTPPPGYGQDVHVNGYFRTDGSYVPPHMRSASDGNPSNNWSTVGNVNPYTSEPGTKLSPDEDDSIDATEGVDFDSDSGGIHDDPDADSEDSIQLGGEDEMPSDAPGAGASFAPSHGGPTMPPILALQVALLVGGEDPGALDGVLGPQTGAALRKYATDNSLWGLSADQVISNLAVNTKASAPTAAAALDGLATALRRQYSVRAQ